MPLAAHALSTGRVLIDPQVQNEHLRMESALECLTAHIKPDFKSDVTRAAVWIIDAQISGNRVGGFAISLIHPDIAVVFHRLPGEPVQLNDIFAG